jgi:hypothetical protein
VARALAGVGGLRIEGLGMAEFEERLRHGATADLDTARRLAPVLRLLGRPPVRWLVLGAVRRFRLWTPLVVVARREAEGSHDGRQ